MKQNAKHRRGFIFSLLVLIVLTFMLIELNIYVRAHELREQLEPTRVRTMVLSEIATKLKQAEMAKISHGAAVDALYFLTISSIASPPSLVKIPDEIKSLMLYGTLTNGTRLLSPEATLSRWDSEYKKLAAKLGISLTTNYEDFVVYHSSPWVITIEYNFSYELYDEYSDTRIKARYPIKVNVSIIDFPDPALTRRTGASRNIVQFNGTFVKHIANVTYGRGWFYGELFNGTCLTESAFRDLEKYTPATVYNATNKEKILCTYDVRIAEDYGNIFGAVLLIKYGPASVNFGRIRVPFAANSTFALAVPLSLLIIAPNDTIVDGTGATALYDISGLRDFVICGKYINNTAAPSFLKRIANDITNDTYGIETVIAARWVPAQWKNFSRVDYEFYRGIGGRKIMGLPGCLWKEMCALERWWINATRLNESHFDIYGVRPLVCTGDRCG